MITTTLTNPAISSELETSLNQAIIWGTVDRINKGQLWELPGKRSIMLIEDNCDDPFILITGSLDSSAVGSIIKLCPLGFPMVLFGLN